jgi:DNA-binding transcriptional MocR family regulator
MRATLPQLALDGQGQSCEGGPVATTIAPTALAALLGDTWRRPREATTALADALRGLVVDGRLAARTRVPSERALAPALGVSRGTVTRAYDRLREDGYLVSARGAGSWLTLPVGHGSPPPRRRSPGSTTRRGRPTCRWPRCPPPSRCSAPRWPAPPGAGPPRRGHGLRRRRAAELRAAVAARFAERGVPTAPEQVLVTAGAQHALHLVLGLLTAPGDRVLVDAPRVPAHAQRAARARTRPVPVPLGPRRLGRRGLGPRARPPPRPGSRSRWPTSTTRPA